MVSETKKGTKVLSKGELRDALSGHRWSNRVVIACFKQL